MAEESNRHDQGAFSRAIEIGYGGFWGGVVNLCLPLLVGFLAVKLWKGHSGQPDAWTIGASWVIALGLSHWLLMSVAIIRQRNEARAELARARSDETSLKELEDWRLNLAVDVEVDGLQVLEWWGNVHREPVDAQLMVLQLISAGALSDSKGQLRAGPTEEAYLQAEDLLKVLVELGLADPGEVPIGSVFARRYAMTGAGRPAAQAARRMLKREGRKLLGRRWPGRAIRPAAPPAARLP